MANFSSTQLPVVDLPSLQISVDLNKVGVWDDLYLLIPLYALAVKGLTHIYTRKDGSRIRSAHPLWRQLILAYNVAMTVFSFGCFASMVLFVATHPLYTENCFEASKLWLFNTVVYLFYVSKYAEFADTVFLIVKGKSVSWLHYLHHMGAALNMGALYHSNFEGTWIFVLLNGFIHTLMYFYYACALLKIRLPGKSVLTSLQILQFFTGLSLLFPYKNVACVAKDPNQMFAYLYSYVYVSGLVVLFSNFFLQNYVVKDRRNHKKAE